MFKSIFRNTLVAAVIAVTLLLGRGNVMRAEVTESDGCTAYLELVSGLSNLACTPGTLSAILVFSSSEPPLPVLYSGDEPLAVKDAYPVAHDPDQRTREQDTPVNHPDS